MLVSTIQPVYSKPYFNLTEEKTHVVSPLKLYIRRYHPILSTTLCNLIKDELDHKTSSLDILHQTCDKVGHDHVWSDPHNLWVCQLPSSNTWR